MRLPSNSPPGLRHIWRDNVCCLGFDQVSEAKPSVEILAGADRCTRGFRDTFHRCYVFGWDGIFQPE